MRRVKRLKGYGGINNLRRILLEHVPLVMGHTIAGVAESEREIDLSETGAITIEFMPQLIHALPGDRVNEAGC